eukprot:SAG31_NODE_9426_length_1278_cov_1.994063_3_plen_95_part_01
MLLLCRRRSVEESATRPTWRAALAIDSDTGCDADAASVSSCAMAEAAAQSSSESRSTAVCHCGTEHQLMRDARFNVDGMDPHNIAAQPVATNAAY